jgi:phosphoglycolate phosphatase
VQVTSIEAILFDFDYTLADSSCGVIDCIGYALSELGLPPVTDEAARRTIGLSLPDTLAALAGPQPKDVSERFARLFLERADQVMADKTVLFPSVCEAAVRLRERGLVLGIVSTKYRRRIEAILAREGLLGLFAAIVGGEDVSCHKPDPESLRLGLDRLGVLPAEALYVGDSVTDAQAAQRAGVPFVAVLSGTTPERAFEAHRLCAVIRTLAELPGLVQKWEVLAGMERFR